MIKQGVPAAIAKRLWEKRALSLIVTHPDDIAKIHIADLRGKYHYVGLDIIEMR